MRAKHLKEWVDKVSRHDAHSAHRVRKGLILKAKTVFRVFVDNLLISLFSLWKTRGERSEGHSSTLRACALSAIIFVLVQ